MNTDCKNNNEPGSLIVMYANLINSRFQTLYDKLDFIDTRCAKETFLYSYDVNKQNPKLFTEQFQKIHIDLKCLDELKHLQEFDTYCGGVMEDFENDKFVKFKESLENELHISHVVQWHFT